MERVERFSIGGKEYARGDCVRLTGHGSGAFRVMALCRGDNGREWLDVFGPVAKDGEPVGKAKQRAVALSDVRCRVRLTPPRSTRLLREGLAPRSRRATARRS